MGRLLKKPVRLKVWQRRLLKAVIHLTVTGYIGTLFWLGVNDQLGGDPVKILLHDTGVTAIILLLITLMVSPIARHLPCPDAMKFRRLLGLYAFFVALVHISTYVSFDIIFDFSLLLEDIVKRPYITVGFGAFIILLLLTLTSPSMIRRKMGRHWQQLHNSVYAALILALLHFSWSVKTALQDPLIYWAIGLVLLGYRLRLYLKRTKRKTKLI